MTDRGGFEAKLEELKSDMERERQIWQMKQVEAETKIKELDAKLAAFNMTLDAYRQFAGISVPTMKQASMDNERFRNMTVVEACETLVREAGGRRKVGEIRKILLAAGKLKNPRTAYNHIRATIEGDSKGRLMLLSGGWAALAPEGGFAALAEKVKKGAQIKFIEKTSAK
jgi:hypothetical protein